MAEEEGFEPPEGVNLQRFSRPQPLKRLGSNRSMEEDGVSVLRRTVVALAAFGLGALGLSACATSQTGPQIDVQCANTPVLAPASPDRAGLTRADLQALADAPDTVEIGVASWYGPGFHGNLTANGEIFDQNALTAAHRTLPLPTRARTTRLDTGDSIMVRINDRGPYIEGRMVDLSRAAAEALGFLHDGLVQVRLESLGPADAVDRAALPVFFDPETGPPRPSATQNTPELDAMLQPGSNEG